MKRQIKALRQALLAIEAGNTICDKQTDPVGWYHAWLLHNGGFVSEFTDVSGLSVDGRYEAGSLTHTGHDLLDELRDEQALEMGQAVLMAKGFDPDYLALYRAWYASSWTPLLSEGKDGEKGLGEK